VFYKNTGNTTIGQAAYVKPMNVTMNISSFPYDHKISDCIVVKTDKIHVFNKNVHSVAVKT
jgi:hypothetical protein